MKLGDIKKTIKAEAEILAGAKLKDLDENIFLGSDFLDSFNRLSLIVFLERRFGIKIDVFFVDRESISSINKLAGLIKKKLDQKRK